MDPIQHYRFLIFTENPDKLMQFYRDVLGLTLDMELKLSNDYGYMFDLGNKFKIWIGKHSEVSGRNKDQFRHILNLYVNDVQAWYEKIKDHPEVEIISKPEVTPT